MARRYGRSANGVVGSGDCSSRSSHGDGGVATWVIIPALLAEDLSRQRSLERSGSLFLDHFGCTVILNRTVGAVFRIVVVSIRVFDRVLTDTYDGIRETGLDRYATPGTCVADLVLSRHQQPPNATLPSSMPAGGAPSR